MTNLPLESNPAGYPGGGIYSIYNRKRYKHQPFSDIQNVCRSFLIFLSYVKP